MTQESSSAPSQAARLTEVLRRKGPSWVSYLVPFLFVIYLGLQGGGFDYPVYGSAGIVAWWAIIVLSALALLPASRLERRGTLAILTFAALAVWTALGILWSDSIEKTVIETARVLSLLGIFTLAVMLQRAGSLERTLVGVGAGIGLVAFLSLGSRIAPGIFPGEQPADLLTEASYRLLFPVGYWNALGALIAIGLPLFFKTAAFGHTTVLRLGASASIPILILTLYYTFSRGGWAAAVIGLVLLALLTPRRLETLVRTSLPILGSILVLIAAISRSDLANGISGPAYQSEADEMAVLVAITATAIVIGQYLLGRLEVRGVNLELRPSRRTSFVVTAVISIFLLGGAAWVDIPGKVSSAAKEFSSNTGPEQGSNRIFSAAGSDRFAYWEAALEGFQSAPVTGIGPGAFEYWWAAKGTAESFVLHAHSLPLQILAESGPLGLLLLTAFFGLLIWTGGSRAIRSGDANIRASLAAATASITAFLATASVDWSWETSVLPVAALFLGASVLGVDSKRANIINSQPRPTQRRGLMVIGAFSVGVVAILWIAVPLFSQSAIEQSRISFEKGERVAALGSIDKAKRIEPWAATPLIQEALVLSSAEDHVRAIDAALEATSKEPTNWRTWLVLSQVSSAGGRPAAASTAFRKAQELNPRSAIFSGEP